MRPEKAEQYQIEILRNMSGAQRLEIAFQLYEMVRNMKRQVIQQENPEALPSEIDQLLAEKMKVE